MKCEWEEVHLGKLCIKIGSGATPRGGKEQYKDHGISFIRSQNILDFSFSFDGLVYIDETQAEKLLNVQVFERDILLNITGDSVARACMVPADALPARVNQHVAIIRGNEHLLTQEFLLYFLQREKASLLSLSSAGATRNALTKNMLEQLMLCPPSLSEQKAIAAVLSVLDDKIELNNRINKNLEAQAQAFFKSWFVDFEPFQDGEFVESELGLIPKGWRVSTLGECSDFYNGYAFKSNDLLDNEQPDCYHVFKMGHIRKGGGLNSEGTKSWIKRIDCHGILKYVLRKGDLLRCMTDMKGNVALLGHTALMSEDDKYIVNQRVGLIRANGTCGIDYPFLYLLTNHKIFLENLRGRANSGVQVNLSTAEIKASQFVLAPKKVNDTFNRLCKPLFELIFENQIQSCTLAALRDALLPKLMSGEIRVPLEV